GHFSSPGSDQSVGDVRASTLAVPTIIMATASIRIDVACEILISAPAPRGNMREEVLLGMFLFNLRNGMPNLPDKALSGRLMFNVRGCRNVGDRLRSLVLLTILVTLS